jgi:hypothetical protein
MRRVRVILARSEVQVRAPGERDGPDRRSFRAHVDAHVGEVCAESGFHLGLDIARQRPSAGLRAQIYLKGIDAGTALNGLFPLHRAGLTTHRAGVDGGKGERANEEDPLQYAASRAAGRGPRDRSRGDPNLRWGCRAIGCWRLHIQSLPRKDLSLRRFIAGSGYFRPKLIRTR